MEFLNYTFIQNSLWVGLLTAISTAMLGNLMVVARQAVMSDMVAHAAIAGVGIGIFWNLSPTFTALATAMVTTLILWWLSRDHFQAPEAISMVLLNGGLAVALLLTHLNEKSAMSLESYLFGSILTISEDEFYSFIALNVLIICILIKFWNTFLTLVFDRDFLQSRKNKTFFELVFMLLVAVIVGIGLKVIGGLLIGAMLVIPVLTAQRFCHSFRMNTIASIGVNIIAVTAGIVSSFYFDVPTSSSIVLGLLLLFALSRFKAVT